MKHQTFMVMMCGFVFFINSIASHGNMIAKAWVPSAFLPQGQVQWMVDDESCRVQVFLHSRFLDRVVNAIKEKEVRNWTQQHPDAATYIRKLSDARSAVRVIDKGKSRESLVIVFLIDSEAADVSWYSGDISKNANGRLEQTNAALIDRWMPPRAYVIRNAALILEDSAGISRRDFIAKIDALLRPEEKRDLAEWLNENP